MVGYMMDQQEIVLTMMENRLKENLLNTMKIFVKKEESYSGNRDNPKKFN